MKPLVKKILESGLISKHAAKMLESWGNIEPGAAELVEQKKLTEKNLEDFLEDIDILLSEREEPLKETALDMEVTVESFTSKETGLIYCNKNKIGQYLVPGAEKFYPGQFIWPSGRSISHHPPAMITRVETLYSATNSVVVLTIDDSEYQRLRALRKGTDLIDK